VPVRRAARLGTWDVSLHVERRVGELIQSHGTSYHQFADDTQLFIAMNTSDTKPAHEPLAVCSSAVRLWFLHNGLQLNADKSEVVILGTGHQLRDTVNITAVEVAGSNMIVSDRLKSLGVTIDSHLRFDCHANNVARACNYHTRALLHIRSLLTDEVAQTVARNIVASRLDYCNILLHGAPAATIVKFKLRRAQNNLARVVCQCGGRTDAAPLLRSLHWLPVKHRITYKTAMLTHRVLTTSTPPYLHEMLTVAAPARPMRSADAPLLFVSRVRSLLSSLDERSRSLDQQCSIRYFLNLDCPIQ